MAKNDLEQSQIMNAISFFKEIKRQAPKGNPKIVEQLDQAERKLQDDLYQLLQNRENKKKKN
jgi:hypothetical protein